MKEQQKLFQTMLTDECCSTRNYQEIIGLLHRGHEIKLKTERLLLVLGVNRLVFGRENNLTIQKDQV